MLQVEAILVNIFGGIVDCGMVARGIQAAYEKLKIAVPLIVRLEGIIMLFSIREHSVSSLMFI